MGKEKENNVLLIPFSREEVRVWDRIYHKWYSYEDEFWNMKIYDNYKVLQKSKKRNVLLCSWCDIYEAEITLKTEYWDYNLNFHTKERYIDRRTRYKRLLDSLLWNHT